MRSLGRQHQFHRRGAVHFLGERGIEAEQRDGVGGDGLERPAGDELQLIEQRPIDDRREDALAHGIDHLLEMDRGSDLHLETPEVLGIVLVRRFDQRRVGPRR